MPWNRFGLVGRASSRRVFTVAAVFALLQPLLAVVDGDLAGWRPDHEHVYAAGIPFEHDHPSSHGAEGDTGDEAGVAFLFELSVSGSILPPLTVAELTEQTSFATPGGAPDVAAFAGQRVVPDAPPPRA
ncbi:MAG: hypothetical protein AB7F65_00315 [Dehalococcoidia bacterium]